jgi:hypothetical protein
VAHVTVSPPILLGARKIEVKALATPNSHPAARRDTQRGSSTSHR